MSEQRLAATSVLGRQVVRLAPDLVIQRLRLVGGATCKRGNRLAKPNLASQTAEIAPRGRRFESGSLHSGFRCLAAVSRAAGFLGIVRTKLARGRHTPRTDGFLT
jgi:hypothetical protein